MYLSVTRTPYYMHSEPEDNITLVFTTECGCFAIRYRHLPTEIVKVTSQVFLDTAKKVIALLSM